VQPGSQPAPHNPGTPPSQHSWPVNGPSSSPASGTPSSGSSQPGPTRPARKPEPEDDLDIPDFLK
jgi:cell division protein FtsZ